MVEFQLLLAAAKHSLGLSVEIPGKQALSRIDWTVFLRFVTFHRLGVQVVELFAAVGIQPPSKVEEKLTRWSQSNALKTIMQQRELQSILFACKERKITIIPYKGVVLREAIYPHVLHRPCDDIDLLVQKTDFGPVLSILKNLGYLPEPGLSLAQSKLEVFFQRAILLNHPVHHIKIDLHTDILERRLGEKVTTEELFSSALPFGHSLRLDSTYDLLVVILHGNKHGWRRLGWLLDLAFYSLHYSNLSKISEQINLHQMQLEAVVSQKLCRRVLGIDVNFHLQKSTDISERSDRIATRLTEAMSNPQPDGIFPDDLRVQIAAQNASKDKLSYLLQRVFTPNNKDFTSTTLPDLLVGGYFLIRPFRLVSQYVLRFLRAKFKTVKH